jgi:hypothetical protein
MVKKIIFLSLIVFTTRAFPDEQVSEQVSLRGIKAVRVTTEISTVSIFGVHDTTIITESELQTDIELKLRLAGITVSPTAAENLIVVVHILNMNTDKSTRAAVQGHAAEVHLELWQDVNLSRDPRVSVRAMTWQSITRQLWGPNETIGNRCRGEARDRADEFLNDYLSVNPR